MGSRPSIEYNGKLYTISQLAEIAGISFAVLQKRLHRGWDLETAMNHKPSRSVSRVTRGGTTGPRTIKTRNPVEYSVWKGILARCNNPKTKCYKDYGGRGITVCGDWLDFSRFLADMGPRPSKHHSIERVENNLGYSKDNCKWATKKEQTINRQTTVFIEFGGLTKCRKDWAKELGISTGTLEYRIREWGIELAMTTKKGQFKGGRYLKLGKTIKSTLIPEQNS